MPRPTITSSILARSLLCKEKHTSVKYKKKGISAIPKSTRDTDWLYLLESHVCTLQIGDASVFCPKRFVCILHLVLQIEHEALEFDICCDIIAVQPKDTILTINNFDCGFRAQTTDSLMRHEIRCCLCGHWKAVVQTRQAAITFNSLVSGHENIVLMFSKHRWKNVSQSDGSYEFIMFQFSIIKL